MSEMTLRDEFAAAALIGTSEHWGRDPEYMKDTWAAAAYAVADAMLAARVSSPTLREQE